MKRILAFILTLSFGIQADIALSSPKVNVNEQGQFLIRFSVNSDSAIRSKDFVLNEYQSEIPLEDNLIAFTLFEEENISVTEFNRDLILDLSSIKISALGL